LASWHPLKVSACESLSKIPALAFLFQGFLICSYIARVVEELDLRVAKFVGKGLPHAGLCKTIGKLPVT
jgi:hypothetical protein